MSTKSVCGMSCGEMHEFALVLDKAGFNSDLVQKIVNSKNNEIAKGMHSALTRGKNTVVETNPYLKKCLSGDTPIIIPACDGSHTLVKARKVFKSYIDPDFKNYQLDKPGEPTKETAVVLHEMAKNATFTQMFGSLGNLDKLCLTQHQIEVFCETHPEWLRDEGCGIFFLTKKECKKTATNGNLFVTVVRVYFDGLHVHAFRFEHAYVWVAVHRRRLAVPQLET